VFSSERVISAARRQCGLLWQNKGVRQGDSGIDEAAGNLLTRTWYVEQGSEGAIPEKGVFKYREKCAI